MKNDNNENKVLSQTSVMVSADCKHDFREFWKTNYYGLLKLKEIKCIYCNEKKI